MVNLDIPLAILRDARDGNRRWIEVAFAVLELERSGSVDDHGRPWIQRAEAETGYSANQLRRMTKASIFVDALIRSEPTLAESLLSRPFSHVDTISKIWPLDQGEARAIIEGRRACNTYRDLYAAYERARAWGGGAAPVVAGKRAAKDFREKAISLLKSDPARLIETSGQADCEIMRPIVPFRYANPDYYIVFRERGKVCRVDAIDCYALHDGSQTEIALRKIVAAATESTFFTRFWIVVPAGASASIIRSERDRLKLANVGVVVVVDGALSWDIVPEVAAKPNPDRRDLWSEYDRKRLSRAQIGD